MIDYGMLYTALLGLGVAEVVGAALFTLSGKRSSNANFFGALLGLVPSLLGVGGSLLGNKSKADAAKSDREMANANEKARAAAVQNLMAQLQARGVDPYGKQTDTSQQTTTSSGTQVTKKLIDPIAKALASKIIAQQEAELDRGDLYGAGQVAQQARQANQMAEAAMAASRNAGASRGLSKEALMAMAMPANLARTRAVLDFQSTLPEKNAAYRAGVRGEGWGTVRDTMGQRVNTSDTSTTTGSRTTGPDISALYALATGAVPQQVSTKTGYSPWAEGLGAAGDLAAAAIAQFSNNKKPTGVQSLPSARDMSWAGMAR